MTSVAKKALPKVDGDFYHISATVSEEDQALLHRVRTFMETEVAPIINEYWIREEFPHQLIPGWRHWASRARRIAAMTAWARVPC